jgi:uncharacterized phiE125 gp8 family phage protein
MSLSAGAARAAPGAPPRAPNMARVAAITPPDAAIGETKSYLRLETGTEDALIARLVAVAIGHGEAFTGQLLIARQVDETMPVTGDWRMLARRPVKAITNVAAQAGIAVPEPLGIDAYAIDIDAAGDGWVRVPQPVGAVRIHVGYRAGLAEQWEDLPEPIRQGVIRLASHLYTHRDAAGEADPPAAVAALWRPWRRMRLA